ncbi:diguanylate cyclase [Massilia arenosa]|uniref:diguanylate cyclase n=1 Tax=Zemynaea arenosa TaxID=2561931 RepID=A0A4Y9RYM6_9BURK|nr:diguanylate cyclase [Massilia arenosa]TFW13331.1 diguanylate cyclase [Massilia arenosa]
MIRCRSPRRAFAPLATASLLVALHAAPASAGLKEDLAEASRLADRDPAQALALLDKLAARADYASVPASRTEILSAKCWLLAYTEPNKAVALVQAQGPQPPIGLRVCRGYAWEQLKRPDDALAEYEAGVTAARRMGDNTVLARALALRGEQRYVRGLYADAIDDLKSSYDLETRLGNQGNRRYVLNALANLYADRNIRDYDHALESYAQLLAVNEKAGNQQGMATAHFNIASTYENKGDLERARQHFAQALQIDKARGGADDIVNDQRAYAVVLSKLGQHERALTLLDEAYTMAQAQPTQDADMIASIHLSRGTAYRRAGRAPQALADLDEARRYFERNRNERFLAKIYEETAATHAQMGNWKAAYAAQAQMMAAQAAIQKQMLDDRTTRLRVQFQSEQARLRNAELQYQNNLQQAELEHTGLVRRWQVAALVASAVVIVLMGVLVVRQRRLGARMRDLALTDELTRLPNRRHLMTVAREAFAQAKKEGRALSIAALDIDHFKRINDTHGHAAGDVVLQRVAHALRMSLRPGDTVGRTGGEEFIAVLRGATEEDAIRAAERLRTAVAQIDVSGLPPGLAPTISVGVAQCDAHMRNLDELIHHADTALYRAKEGGRNRVERARQAA